ncbi:MAG: hypothetical protein CL662_01100 [Bacteroidetes bacterium]|nr:hypothetical protein [Bacteroidota bacterium]
MPSHYGGSTKKKKGQRTNAQKLKEHSKHHTKKHMDMMKKDMKAGMSFSAAHKKAQRLVGK